MITGEGKPIRGYVLRLLRCHGIMRWKLLIHGTKGARFEESRAGKQVMNCQNWRCT